MEPSKPSAGMPACSSRQRMYCCVARNSVNTMTCSPVSPISSSSRSHLELTLAKLFPRSNSSLSLAFSSVSCTRCKRTRSVSRAAGTLLTSSRCSVRRGSMPPCPRRRHASGRELDGVGTAAVSDQARAQDGPQGAGVPGGALVQHEPLLELPVRAQCPRPEQRDQVVQLPQVVLHGRGGQKQAVTAPDLAH